MMEPFNLKVLMALMVIILMSIAAFCYDLGCAANTFLPGRGDQMINLAIASAALTVLTAVNLMYIHARGGAVKAVPAPAAEARKPPAPRHAAKRRGKKHR